MLVVGSVNKTKMVHFSKKIEPSYLQYNYLNFPKKHFNQYFKHNQKVRIIEEDGQKYFLETHSEHPRVDKIGSWYKKYNIQKDIFIGIKFDKFEGENAIFLTKRYNIEDKNSLNTEDNIIAEVFPDEITETTNQLFEGSKKQIFVNQYERNNEARQKCIDFYGYRCTVCEIQFDEKYGNIGKNFIHVHHLIPISSIRENYLIDPIKDLRPVCPNCHAMLHKKLPPYTIEELKMIIFENS